MPDFDPIKLIQDGELVRAAIANRAPRQLDQNLRYLRELFEAALLGETVFARAQTVEVDAKVGMAVYYNPVTQQFERALGSVEVDSATGEILTTMASHVWGLVYQKLLSTKADILLHGVANFDLTEAIDDAVQPGKLYYLSNSAPGKLVYQRPPVGVVVAQVAGENADDTYKVYVNTKFQDLLEAHKHYHFELAAVPAGDYVPPAEGETHQITNPDVTMEGWLPADHVSFEGNAPAGAQFGYNLAASIINNLWPPQPVEGATLEILRSLAISPAIRGFVTVPSDLCVIDRNGIWWMSSCYGDVPWPTDYGTVESASESESCPATQEMQLVLWFTKPMFQTTSMVVLSLRAAASSGLSVVCTDTGEPASTGHLLLDLDLGITMGGSNNEPGYLAFKRLEGNVLHRGPIVESLRAGSSNVTIAGSLTGNGKTYGDVVVSVAQDLDGAERIIDTIRLDGVTEEYYEETIALGFVAGRLAEYRGRVLLPANDAIVVGTRMKLRFTVLSRSSDTLPADIFSLSYRRLPHPAALLTPCALPTIDTGLADLPAVAVGFAAANQYFIVESEEFAVAAGDVVFFTLQRQGNLDGYGGDLHILRQCGVLVAGS